MESVIYKAISGWASASTWYTSHDLDQNRFNEAMAEVIVTAGTDITYEQFENALRQHVSKTPASLGQPTEWDKIIAVFTEKAMAIISYEASR